MNLRTLQSKKPFSFIGKHNPMQSVFFYVLQTLMTNVDPKHVILCTCWDTPSDDTTFFETIIKSKPCLYDVLLVCIM